MNSKVKFDKTSKSWKTAIPHTYGQAMAVFRELWGEKWARDIGSALYYYWSDITLIDPITP